MAGPRAPKSMQGLRRENRITECSDCKGTDIGFDNGERFCKKCGLVLD